LVFRQKFEDMTAVEFIPMPRVTISGKALAYLDVSFRLYESRQQMIVMSLIEDDFKEWVSLKFDLSGVIFAQIISPVLR
jgi:hypothetical protein